jgi:4'-phosphopantetheinyl transferase
MKLYSKAEDRAKQQSGDVYVFSSTLTELSKRMPFYESLLIPNEKIRTQKFKSEKARTEFILSRGYLREKLSHFLDATDFEMVTDHFGKPTLKSNKCFLQFNLSHSSDRVVLAVTYRNAVGIDIEKINGEQNLEVAKHVFSQNELLQLQRLSENKKIEGFFKGWTQKEAYIKANGQGMSYPLKTFTVQLDPEVGAEVLHNELKNADEVTGEMKTLEIDPAYSCSLYVQHKTANIILSA